MRLRLAHLSDLHLPLPAPPALADLLGKRAFGYVNWQRNRRKALGGAILERLLADLAAQSADHICITGDLVNIATDAEFAAATRFLEGLGPPSRISLVPGNHDAYVPGAAGKAAAAWAPWIGGVRFPVARRIDGVALIGVSSAVATPPLFASGRVGAAQRDALSALLDRHDDAFKVALIHHPPDRALSRGRRGLTDVDAVREVLAAGCIDLVLHGHTHEPSLRTLPTARGIAAVVGVPSASSDGRAHAPAGYALVDLIDGGVRITRRTINAAGTALHTTSVDEIASSSLAEQDAATHQGR